MKENTSEDKLFSQWNQSNQTSDTFTDKALIDQLVKISMFEQKERSIILPRQGMIFRVVALLVCVVLLTSTIYLFLEQQESSKIVNNVYAYSVCHSTGEGELKTVTLSDGTSVTLNSMSTIIYPSEFVEDKREVTLIGEAFFDVAKNRDMPFIVKTDMMDIEALGTAFEVSAYKSSDRVVAILQSGSVKVSLSGKIANCVILQPNQMASIVKESNDICIDSVIADNMVSWKDGVLIFDQTKLSDVFESVSKRFGVDIICDDDKLNNVMINATILKEMDIDNTMQILSEIGEFKYDKHAMRYIIE